jgi:hypothetical protein
VFDDDFQITPEIEHFICSLGSPAVGSRHGMKDQTIAMAEVVLMDFDGKRANGYGTQRAKERRK